MDADRKTGILVRKYETISKDMGVPVPTLKNWMGNLKKEGYIKTQLKGDCMSMEITNYHPDRSIKSDTPSMVDEKARSIKSGIKEYQIDPQGVSNRGEGTKNSDSLNGCKDSGLQPRSINSDTSPKILNRCLKDKPLVADKKLKGKAKSKPKPKSKPPAKKKTNPDIKIAIDFYHDQFLEIRGEKPHITGGDAKTIQAILKSRSLEELKNLIRAYLEDKDSFISEKGWPLMLLPSRINKYLVSGINKTGTENDKKVKRIKAEFLRIRDSGLNNSGLEDWTHKINQLQLEVKKYNRESGGEALTGEQNNFLIDSLKKIEREIKNEQPITR